MRELLKNAALLLFPQRCVFCDSVTAGETRCCPACEKRLRRNGAEAVLRLTGLTVYSCFYYKERGKQTLDRFKFYGTPELADYFAWEMGSLLEERLGGFPFDRVAFLPMPELRRSQRGYNQGELLAAALAARYGVPCGDCGLTREGVFAQHDLNSSMRRKQRSGGFAMTEGTRLSGRILLADDITTTGSSLLGCAGLLRQAGAEEVTAVCAAG